MLKQRKQIRLREYDYSRFGYYYITICTENRSCIFGCVFNGKMILNDVGKIINNVWLTISKHFNNVELDSFQIMPNHIHGIIIVGAGSSRPISFGSSRPISSVSSRPTLGQIIGYFKYQSTKHINNVRVGCSDPIDINNVRVGCSDPIDKGANTAPLQNLPIQNLTIQNSMTFPKIFQRNYYEHIIRNEQELYKIREYIKSNPMLWNNDVNYLK